MIAKDISLESAWRKFIDIYIQTTEIEREMSGCVEICIICVNVENKW